MTQNLYTYTSLAKAIASWCNRSVSDTAFYEQIPVFVSLTEQEMFVDETTLGNQIYVEGNLTLNSPLLAKPAGWGKTLTLSLSDDIDQTVSLVQRFSYEASLLYRKTLTQTGKPLYYQDKGYDYLYLTPTPDQPYRFEWAYLEKINPLTLNNQTNWNTRNAYDILFYGCLAQAFLYLDNRERSLYFTTLFKDRVKAMNAYDMGRLLDRTADASMRLLGGL